MNHKSWEVVEKRPLRLFGNDWDFKEGTLLTFVTRNPEHDTVYRHVLNVKGLRGLNLPRPNSTGLILRHPRDSYLTTSTGTREVHQYQDQSLPLLGRTGLRGTRVGREEGLEIPTTDGPGGLGSSLRSCCQGDVKERSSTRMDWRVNRNIRSHEVFPSITEKRLEGYDTKLEMKRWKSL